MNRIALSIAAAIAAMAAFLPTGANAGPDDIPLRIEDTNGKVLGRAWWFADQWNAVMQGATQVFAVPLTSVDDLTRLDFDRRGSVYYTTKDCTGQAYLLPWMGYGTVRAAIAIHSRGGPYELLIASGVPERLTINSRQGAPRKCKTRAMLMSVAPVVETIFITDTYQPPFSVR
jgi:hypothetical protein